jgi:hypothetical protein
MVNKLTETEYTVSVVTSAEESNDSAASSQMQDILTSL